MDPPGGQSTIGGPSQPSIPIHRFESSWPLYASQEIGGAEAVAECSQLDSFAPCLNVPCPNEKERTHAQTVILRSLSYMWCRCREALCAAFRCSAFKTARRPDVCRFRGHREEMNSPGHKLLIKSASRQLSSLAVAATPDKFDNRKPACLILRAMPLDPKSWRSAKVGAYSCRTMLRRDLWTLIPPL
jgi:hypothetical protein